MIKVPADDGILGEDGPFCVIFATQTDTHTHTQISVNYIRAKERQPTQLERTHPHMNGTQHKMKITMYVISQNIWNGMKMYRRKEEKKLVCIREMTSRKSKQLNRVLLSPADDDGSHK
jgi:hypothetical protein